MVLDTNNDLFTPTALGTIRSFSTFRESISQIDDLTDFYTFSLANTSNLSISLSGLSSNARVDLIKNVNNSRFGDPGETIKTLNASGFSGTMSVAGLGVGQYALRVAEGTTPYEMTISPTVGFGPHEERFDADDIFGGMNLDVLNGTRVFSGSLNANANDSTDFYRFRVDVPTKLDVSFSTAGDGIVLPILKRASAGFELTSFNTGAANQTLTTASADTLLPGEYVFSPATTDISSYTMTLDAKPIERAELSVFVGRVSTNVNFGSFDAPDFFVKATIDGTRQKTRTVDDRKTVDFNETLTQAVNPNKRLIPIKLEVIDSDGGLRFEGDDGDINDIRGTLSLSMDYDIVTRRFQLNNGSQGLKIEGDTITATGNGDDGKATTINFRINYNTFGFGQNFFSNSTPTTIDSNRSSLISGLNVGGIVDGAGGNDKVYARGGADIAMGGVGNDYVDGGTGDDVIFGGIGKDTCVGGKGRDTFVLAPGTGIDVINDYRNGDQLGLTNGLTFEMLEITQKGRNTVIGLGDEKLAILKGMRANLIGAEDFVAIDFTNFKGMEVPTLMS